MLPSVYYRADVDYSCNQQIPASSLLVKGPDVTRSTVQKAVVVLAAKPVFGPIRFVLIRGFLLSMTPIVSQGQITCGDHGLVPSKVCSPRIPFIHNRYQTFQGFPRFEHSGRFWGFLGAFTTDATDRKWALHGHEYVCIPILLPATQALKVFVI
jgi:hypothetical protein